MQGRRCFGDRLLRIFRRLELVSERNGFFAAIVNRMMETMKRLDSSGNVGFNIQNGHWKLAYSLYNFLHRQRPVTKFSKGPAKFSKGRAKFSKSLPMFSKGPEKFSKGPAKFSKGLERFSKGRQSPVNLSRNWKNPQNSYRPTPFHQS